MTFPDGFTPTKGLAISKEVFELMHQRGLSPEETFGICALLMALAGETLGIPKHDTVKAVRGAFDVVEAWKKDIPRH